VEYRTFGTTDLKVSPMGLRLKERTDHAHQDGCGDILSSAWWVDELAGQLAAIEGDVMASPEFEAHVYRPSPSLMRPIAAVMDPQPP